MITHALQSIGFRQYDPVELPPGAAALRRH